MFVVPDTPTLVVVICGALAAGFTTGFAGFGTGLVASGLWFHALPSATVPPMVALTAVAAQLVGLAAVRRAFDWRRASPYLAGGAAGVPLGVIALSLASPQALRSSIGLLLLCYGVYHLSGMNRRIRPHRASRLADGAVGAGGGFLGGFAGLSGPLPLIWLRIQGGPADSQRATYQPFNLIVLSLASIGMLIGGQIDRNVLSLVALCVPATLVGAGLGVKAYRRVPERIFHRVVLVLLTASGVLLLAQTIFR